MKQFLPLLLLPIAPLFANDQFSPDISPVISKAGELIFSDDFDHAEINPKWVPLHGTQWAVIDGALQGKPSTDEFQQNRIAAGDKAHSGRTPSSRLMVESDDCIMLFRFKLSDTLKGAHFGFNDGTYQTGTGHVCRFAATTSGLTLQKDKNAKIKDDVDEELVANDFPLKEDTWYWMMVEVIGDQIAAQVSGSPVLRAQHSRIDTPKDQINLPTRGGGTIYYDHVRVWAASPIDKP